MQIFYIGLLAVLFITYKCYYTMCKLNCITIMQFINIQCLNNVYYNKINTVINKNKILNYAIQNQLCNSK